MTHKELKQKALARKCVKKEYDELSTEFILFKRLLNARKKVGLTQADVAVKMGTKAPAVTRLESSLISRSHSPSLTTLEKYANAVGCHLDIRLLKSKKVANKAHVL